MPKVAVKILSIQPLASRIRAYRVEKPAGYSFVPGQACEAGVNRPGWETEFRPFTFTSLPDEPFLEFNIKSYNDHEGVTKLLGTLKPGDQLLVGSSWGDMAYKGPGLFIAGGTGLTPFISIFRDLAARKALAGNRLYWANGGPEDVFRADEVKAWVGSYTAAWGRVNPAEVARLSRPGEWVYVCGPSTFEDAVKAALVASRIPEDRIVLEE